MISLAFSKVIPFFALNSANLVAYSSNFGELAISIISTPFREIPKSLATLSISALIPKTTGLATPNSTILAAAVTTLSSSPSGKTTVLPTILAFSLILTKKLKTITSLILFIFYLFIFTCS